MSILAVEDIGIAFGGLIAVAGVTFAVEPGESFGVVLLEGMAAQTPVVASDLPGYHNVARSGADAIGLIFWDGTPPSW